jgi:hypothetical protein
MSVDALECSREDGSYSRHATPSRVQLPEVPGAASSSSRSRRWISSESLLGAQFRSLDGSQSEFAWRGPGAGGTIFALLRPP